MNYKTHLVGGFIAGSYVAKSVAAGPLLGPGLILAGGLGGLLPDIDHPKSFLGRRFKITSHFLDKTTGHRGATHIPTINALVFIMLNKVTKLFTDSNMVSIFLLSIFLGILSHIFLDIFNRMGVPLLYPLNKSYISFGKIKVNSVSETIVRFFLILVLLSINFNYIVSYI